VLAPALGGDAGRRDGETLRRPGEDGRVDARLGELGELGRLPDPGRVDARGVDEGRLTSPLASTAATAAAKDILREPGAVDGRAIDGRMGEAAMLAPAAAAAAACSPGVRTLTRLPAEPGLGPR
jgi:hypothetical protein